MDAVGEVCIVLATSRMGKDHIKFRSQAGLQYLCLLRASVFHKHILF